MFEGGLRVAIVGGGVSGVYTAWQLVTTGRVKPVAVFEADNHIGGRLLSLQPPKIPHMMAEAGGMRFLPQVQPLITKLVKSLDLETYPLPVDRPENIAYMRGTHLRLWDFQHCPRKVPYHLTYQEFGNTATGLIVNAIEQIVPGITDPNLNDHERRKMAREARFDNVPLYKQGFWNVLSRVMSGEAYQLGVDAGGYQSSFSNWNAADAIPWYLADFGIGAAYVACQKGYQEIPLKIAELFKRAGGEIRLNTRLRGFEWNRKKKTFELHFDGMRSIEADSLVLAMPRRSLELVLPGSLPLQNITGLIQSVTPKPLFKLFATYEYPWWRTAGARIEGKYIPLQAGRTTTDLPVRQTYYWPYNTGKPVVKGRGMLMASYDDGLNISYWDGFRSKRGRAWRDEARNVKELEQFRGEADRENSPSTSKWRDYPAPARMVQEIQRQLTLIHGFSFIPDVVDACYKDWGDDPFGGGWNAWNIGVESSKVSQEILQPCRDDEEKLPLYICGEAYSLNQGWVEGALETADEVLAKIKSPKGKSRVAGSAG